MRRFRCRTRILGFALGLALWSRPELCAAQSTIKTPGYHFAYDFEAEPHLVLAPLDPPGYARGDGWGLGFRGTIEVLRNGFVKTINNSVGISFGADWVHYSHLDYRGRCTDYVWGPNGTRICREVDGDYRDYFYLPVAMQWNFWLHRRWSVFAEPGLLFYVHSHHFDFSPLAFYVGGRFHFSDSVALTVRLGYPTFSIGASFFL